MKITITKEEAQHILNYLNMNSCNICTAICIKIKKEAEIDGNKKIGK